ncbi:hypothetical protein H0H87_012278 [Tephrocybe sp. NHM501043]|nr:hypothetical protein H0H87_012278 [Tephrocybe sp. NHM501043]
MVPNRPRRETPAAAVRHDRDLAAREPVHVTDVAVAVRVHRVPDQVAELGERVQLWAAADAAAEHRVGGVLTVGAVPPEQRCGGGELPERGRGRADGEPVPERGECVQGRDGGGVYCDLAADDL